MINIIFFLYIFNCDLMCKKILYRVSGNSHDNAHVERTRLTMSQKVLYHFAILVIVNEKLIIKD